MSLALLGPVIALLPVSLLLSGGIAWAYREKTVPTLLQLVGAASFLIVVLAHIFEALHLLAWMNWGLEHSPGHYLDLSSAILGLILFPIGYLLQALRTSPR